MFWLIYQNTLILNFLKHRYISLTGIWSRVCSYKHGLFTCFAINTVRYYSSEETLFKKCIQTQLLIAPKSCEVSEDVSKLLPILRRYMSNDVGDNGRAEIIKILKKFTKMCHLHDEDEPHLHNQRILYNSGNMQCHCLLFLH